MPPQRLWDGQFASGDFAMIDIEEIERDINKIEHSRDTTYAACQRLAWLYIVRDHLTPQRPLERTQYLEGSEFLELSSGVPYRQLMTVIDDHLEAIRLLYPKSYESLLDKIRKLR